MRKKSNEEEEESDEEEEKSDEEKQKSDIPIKGKLNF